MGYITIGERSVGEMSDSEILAWIEGNKPFKRGICGKTARMWLAILRVFEEVGPPMTCRGVFYQLVARDVVEKTEQACSRVQYHLLEMRRRGIIPYDFISDPTRWMRKPDSYASMGDFLEQAQRLYRRDLWDKQDAYVEIWCEKDAIAGILYDVTAEFDVPLMVARGQASDTFLFGAAEALIAKAEEGKTCYIYHFGDSDRWGREIGASIERKLRAFGAVFHFEVAAVTREQIEAWQLPTRPPKKGDNTKGGVVEVDAIPPDKLRAVVRDCIERHIEPEEWARLKRVEEAEKESLAEFLANFRLT